jgi:hypothetical protein
MAVTTMNAHTTMRRMESSSCDYFFGAADF